MIARPHDTGFHSDTGPHRPRNEDLALSDVDQGVFLVADGLGGAAAGDRAARVAADTLHAVLAGADSPLTLIAGTLPVGESRTILERAAPTPEGLEDAELRLRFALLLAHHAVLAEGRASGCCGMATAVVVAWLAGDTCWLAHVGDCRAYVLERGDLSLLTRDHSLSAALTGRITLPHRAEDSPFLRSRLTQVVGGESEPVPDLRCWVPSAGSRLLLCSDGVWGCLEEDGLRSLLGGAADAGRAARDLVGAALEAGSRDNATALVVSF